MNPPKVFSVFWKMISPFIDKKTSTKIQMINTKTTKGADELNKRIEVELTDDVPGGPCTAVFDVEVREVALWVEGQSQSQSLAVVVVSKWGCRKAAAVRGLGGARHSQQGACARPLKI